MRYVYGFIVRLNVEPATGVRFSVYPAGSDTPYIIISVIFTYPVFGLVALSKVLYRISAAPLLKPTIEVNVVDPTGIDVLSGIPFFLRLAVNGIFPYIPSPVSVYGVDPEIFPEESKVDICGSVLFAV